MKTISDMRMEYYNGSELIINYEPTPMELTPDGIWIVYWPAYYKAEDPYQYKMDYAIPGWQSEDHAREFLALNGRPMFNMMCAFFGAQNFISEMELEK